MGDSMTKLETKRSLPATCSRGGRHCHVRRLLTAAVVVTSIMIGSSVTANASYYIDPAVLHIGSGQGTSCVTGGCPIYNGEVNATGNDRFDIYYNQAKGPALDTSVLAIFAVPNGASLPANAITSAMLFSTFSTSSSAGGTPVTATFGPGGYNLTYANQATGLVGDMTGGNVYDFLSAAAGGSGTTFGELFAAGDNSVSFNNMHAADLAVKNIDSGSFSIYVLGMDTTAFAGHSVLDVHFNGLPNGTFIFGFGYQGSPTSNPNPYDTPFTEAGVTDPPVPSPEPGSIGLLGCGLVALAYLRRRRHSPRAG